MRSEAQKRADKAHAKKVRRVFLPFNREKPSDVTMLEHLDKQPNMTEYIKDLIDKDMNNDSQT